MHSKEAQHQCGERPWGNIQHDVSQEHESWYDSCCMVSIQHNQWHVIHIQNLQLSGQAVMAVRNTSVCLTEMTVLAIVLDCRINFWSPVFTLAASANSRLLLFSVPTTLLLASMLVLHHLFVLPQILILFGMAATM